jgi:rhodanese-related sulfurtransferase
MAKTMRALKADELKLEMEAGAWLLDTRAPEAFAASYVPGAVNIGLNGQYAPWVGALIPFGTRLVLVTDEGKQEEALVRLARIGYENVAGYLENSVKGWTAAGYALETIPNLSPAEAKAKVDAGAKVLDIRREAEYAIGHVVGATLRPLEEYPRGGFADLSPNETYLVHCAGGYRSMIAASLLRNMGHTVLNVAGGYSAIAASGVFSTEDGVCPTQAARQARLEA